MIELDMKYSILVSAILIGTLLAASSSCIMPSSTNPSPLISPTPSPPPVNSQPFSRIAPLSENKTGWTIFSTDNGLSENCTTSVIQDKQGVLWVTSFGKGITRFDGLHWEKYSDFPRDVNIYASAQDTRDNLWFGTDSGVYEYTGKEWRNFTPDNTNSGLPGFSVLPIFADNQGNMWCATEVGRGRLPPLFYGPIRYDGTIWTTFNLNSEGWGPQVETIFQDGENNIWVGTNWGVFRYDGTDWQHFTTENGLADNYVHAIAQDDQGNIWFGTSEGASRYDGKNWRTFTLKYGFIDDEIDCMLKDNKGNMWFGSYATDRIFRFDGTNMQSFNPWPSRVYYHVRSIFQDDEGNIWFSTTIGLVRYTPD
jgi:ligand-binding sensor domain-containing protein